MLRRALGMSALFVLVSLVGGRAQEPDTKAAQAAVDSWLSLIDAAEYAKSWDESATSFKNAITSEKWQAAVKAARGRAWRVEVTHSEECHDGNETPRRTGRRLCRV